MTPNYDRAATAAAEILIKYGICTAPVDPIPIFKKADGFNVVTFTEMSHIIGIDRQDLLSSFDASNHGLSTMTTSCPLSRSSTAV